MSLMPGGVNRGETMAKANRKKPDEKVTRAGAEAAVRALLRWAGEDPHREGLRDTPKRVVDAYRDWFSGYASDPRDYLRRTFEEVEGLRRDGGLARISPSSRSASTTWRRSSAARTSVICRRSAWSGSASLRGWWTAFRAASRVQEKLTAQIASCIDDVLKPRGVGVVIDAVHQCMTTRGVAQAAGYP